jgi:hypothetical protein
MNDEWLGKELKGEVMARYNTVYQHYEEAGERPIL